MTPDGQYQFSEDHSKRPLVSHRAVMRGDSSRENLFEGARTGGSDPPVLSRKHTGDADRANDLSVHEYGHGPITMLLRLISGTESLGGVRLPRVSLLSRSDRT